jgi:hypothetical protein
LVWPRIGNFAAALASAKGFVPRFASASAVFEENTEDLTEDFLKIFPV